MRIITTAIATVIALPVVLAFQFGVWTLESWVAMKVWQWHVGPTTWVTLWQLIWVNAAFNVIMRQYRPNHEEWDSLSGHEKWLRFKNLMQWSVSPLLLLALAWFLK